MQSSGVLGGWIHQFQSGVPILGLEDEHTLGGDQPPPAGLQTRTR